MIVNMCKRSATSQKGVVDQLRASLGDKLISSEIIDREQVRQALQASTAVWRHTPTDRDAMAFKAVCDQILDIRSMEAA